jgi:hypothetical protein
MTIGEPFRFGTNEMPLAKVIRGLCFPLMLAFVACASSITMQSHPANAMAEDQGNSAEDQAYSQDMTESCHQQGGAEVCDQLHDIFDPRVNGVSRFHLEVSFDPTQFKFDPRGSGPLCSFADGGTPCPEPHATLGGPFLVRKDNILPGIPPAGSNLCFSEPRNGVIVVDYTLPAPVNLSTDQNVFVLTFDLVKPISADVPLFATYFGTPGDHQFNQIESSCNGGTVRCFGKPPIFGVDTIIGHPPKESGNPHLQ